MGSQPKDFSRVIDDRCLFCHNGYPAADGKLAEGIDCQRGHGPGARHVELASAGQPAGAAIVNPKKLDPARQEESCLQCHLETTSAELPAIVRRVDCAPNSLRPCEAPGTYVVHFDDGLTNKFEVVNQGYRMHQSACYLKSAGKLQCISCHNPHAAKVADFHAQCMSCHTTPHRKDDCVTCHMPRRAVEDVPHVSMTDHKIAIHKKESVTAARAPEVYSPNLTATDRDLYPDTALIVNGKSRKEGIALLERVTDPPARGLAALGEAYFAEGRKEESATTLRKAIAKDPALPKAHYNLGQVLEDPGELEQALRLQPNFPEAEVHYRAALKLRPNYAEAAGNLGSQLLSTGQLQAAQDALELALRIDPAQPSAHNNLGRLYAEKKHWPQSIRLLKRSTALDPATIDARFNLARVLQESGDTRAAITEYRILLSLHPNFVEGHLALGQCLGDAGQIDAAIAEFRETLRLKPDHPLAQQNLAMALSLRRQ